MKQQVVPSIQRYEEDEMAAAEANHPKLAEVPKEPRLIGVPSALRILGIADRVSYIVDPSLSLTCHNKAWDKFALENAAPKLAGLACIGTNILSITDESLRPFYKDAFQKVQREKKVWEWRYTCSSPQVFRRCLMRVHPISLSGWLLVTNSLIIESEHAAGTSDSALYVDVDKQIQVCVHCRCSKRVAQPERWDFVPANLKPEMAVRQALCPICKLYFYPSCREKTVLREQPRQRDNR
jgi:hypothetical protein